MLGGSSFQLGRILGIRIGVNASWFLILFLFLFWLSALVRQRSSATRRRATSAAVVAAVLFFGSIVLHELGHALAARRSGIEVAGIDLFFFGGVMKMSRDTDTPGREFFVAVAGPLVTLAIVLVGTAVGIALAGQDEFLDAARLDAARRRRTRGPARLLPGDDERGAARVQPRAGVPARRRPDRPRGDLEGHGRPRQGHAHLGLRRPGLRGAADGLRHLPGLDGQRDRRALARRARLPAVAVRAQRGAPVGGHLAPGGRDRRRHHGRRPRHAARRTCRSSRPTRTSSCATRAGRGSRSSRPTGATRASPTARRSSRPPSATA